MSNPSIYANELNDNWVACAHRVRRDDGKACDACFRAHVQKLVAKVANVADLLDASTAIAPRDARVGDNELVVAGAGADGHGVITGWHGDGDMLRSQLVERARAAGIPDEWLPAPAAAETQLRRAVQAVAGSVYHAKHERKRDRQSTEAREPVSRWMLVSRAIETAVAGAKYGDIALVVTMYDGGELLFDGEPALATAVRADFELRTGSERYEASDVTRWIARVLRFHCGGVAYGVGWYIPRRTRTVAEALVEQFSASGWGKDWIAPPTPIATSAQLAAGIAAGLIAEVDEVLADLGKARERIRASRNDRTADVTARGAETYMVRLTRVGARVTSYAQLLDDATLKGCRDAIADAMIGLDAAIEGGVTDAMIRAAQDGRVEAGLVLS